ncbi:MAG: EAL domain-containing protein [Williamsia herbipolensis]|nr:EAL domain-containing protein [Williamsia herbipolensis]
MTPQVVYQPILDVARGVAAGFQAQVHLDRAGDVDPFFPSPIDRDEDGLLTAEVARTALAAFESLPPNTFLSLPVCARVAASPRVRGVLRRQGKLSGIVLDVTYYSDHTADRHLNTVLDEYRDAGALIAVGGNGAAQPELTSIVTLKPSIIRLGRDWVRGIDDSEAKRSAVEVIGQLAGQLDAWILSEGVSSSAELRALSSLGVPLAQGPFIGRAQPGWREVDTTARTVLPPPSVPADGALRALLQRAYTTTNLSAAAAVLPETTGFDAVVVVDEYQRPLSILERGSDTRWEATDALAVNVATSVSDAVSRAMLRPRDTRFAPLVCTDDAGSFLGILRIERLMSHLTAEPAGGDR